MVRREVIDDRVQKSIAGYERQFPRFLDAYQAVKWLLEIDCEAVGARQASYEGGFSHRFYKQEPENEGQVPTVSVIYWHDDETVIILCLSAG